MPRRSDLLLTIIKVHHLLLIAICYVMLLLCCYLLHPWIIKILNNSRYNRTVNSWVQILLVKVTIPLIWVSWRKWSVKSPLWRPSSKFHKVRQSTILKYETTEDYNNDLLLLKIQDILFSGLVISYLFR